MELTDETKQVYIELTVQLAYYPPYHSKYNPVERVWGVLDQHWNGALLDSRQTVLRFASTMTYNHRAPIVKFIDHTYQTGGPSFPTRHDRFGSSFPAFTWAR